MSRDDEDRGSSVPGGSEDLYIRVDNADDFWLGECGPDPADGSEIEEIVRIPSDADLVQLDNTLRMFVTFCAAYHGGFSYDSANVDQYLPLPSDMQHAVQELLASELFKYHTDRMLGIVMAEAQEVS